MSLCSDWRSGTASAGRCAYAGSTALLMWPDSASAGMTPLSRPFCMSLEDRPSLPGSAGASAPLCGSALLSAACAGCGRWVTGLPGLLALPEASATLASRLELCCCDADGRKSRSRSRLRLALKAVEAARGSSPA